MIIAVEGLDGSGKTEVSARLAELLGARLDCVPPRSLLLANVDFMGLYRSPARYLYYLAGVKQVAEMASDELVVSDRYLASAHALHVAVRDSTSNWLRQLPLPRADLTIFLEVEEVERRRRLAGRNKPLDPFERALAEDAHFRTEVEDVMRDYADLIVDTSCRTVSEVVESICSLRNTRR